MRDVMIGVIGALALIVLIAASPILGKIHIQVNGVTIGTGTTVNFQSSQGMIATGSPNSNGANITLTPDTNIVEEIPVAQTGKPNVIFPSVNGTMATASTNPVFLAYSPGATFSTLPSAAFPPGASVDLNGIGPLPLVDINGNPLSAPATCQFGCLLQAVADSNVPNPQGLPVNAFMVH